MNSQIKLVNVKLAIIDNGKPGEIEDAINETLRPARLDPQNSLIVDYAFNTTGNFTAVPTPTTVAVDLAAYEEGEAFKQPDLDSLLESWTVLPAGMWDNDEGPRGWHMVVNDEGSVAYFANMDDAARFRLAEINRILNP